MVDHAVDLASEDTPAEDQLATINSDAPPQMPFFPDYTDPHDPPWHSEEHCPWCFLGLRPADHGDLRAAGAAVLSRRSSMLTTPGHLGDPSMAFPHWTACLSILGLCVAQVKLLQPGEETDETIRGMHVHGLLSAVPPGAPPGAPPDASGSAEESSAAGAAAVPSGGASKRKNKANQREWWTDPDDAEWRSSPWILNDPSRSRTVKVKGDGDGWHVLDTEPAQQVLSFYDRAARGGMLKNVVMQDGHVWDYKFEGGACLTQWNPMFPDRRPREVMVVYAACADATCRWS